MPPHVFVETNWVVAYAAPAHTQVPAAIQLMEKARNGQLILHLPALCLTEARHPLRNKFQPRSAADSVRKYLAWATRAGKVDEDSAASLRKLLDQYEATNSPIASQVGNWGRIGKHGFAVIFREVRVILQDFLLSRTGR